MGVGILLLVPYTKVSRQTSPKLTVIGPGDFSRSRVPPLLQRRKGPKGREDKSDFSDPV